MNFILNIIKGMLIGVANVIPGVSGGTMAVSLGIYDKLISCISSLFKKFLESISFLFPILLGCGLGIICFAYTIEHLLTRHTFVTCMAFVGLILGGLPQILSSLKKKKEEATGNPWIAGVILFVIAMSISILLPMMKQGAGMESIPVTPVQMGILLVIGVIASATMVIPGVSGSMMLMIFGYYYGIINTIKIFFDGLAAFDLPVMKDAFLLLFPFGIGVIAGIFLIAKLITFLFDRFGVQTYCTILGLVAASPFAIFYQTGLFEQLHDLTLWTVAFGVMLMLGGAFITWYLGTKNSES